MSADARLAEPLHRQLKAAILGEVTSGAWAPHVRIASERELCDAHGVSRTTARRALADLVHEGVLYTVGGKGTFVADRPLRQELRPLVGFDQDLRGQGIPVRSRVLASARVEADAELAALLGLRLHSPVLRLSRLRLTRDQPLAIQTSHLPEHLVPGLLRIDFATRSLFAALREDYGLDLVGGSSTIQAGLADAEERRLLGLEAPAAVLRTFQTTLLAGGAVIEHCASSFHGEHFQLTQGVGRVAPWAVAPVYRASRGGER